MRRVCIWMLALAVTACMGAAHAALIPLPDSDTFSDGSLATPVPGWTGSATESGGVAVITTANYSWRYMQRNGHYTKDWTNDAVKKLTFSWDMDPDLISTDNHRDAAMGIEVLTPTAADPEFGDNDGVGYMALLTKDGLLRLIRDPRRGKSTTGVTTLISQNILGTFSSAKTTTLSYTLDVEVTDVPNTTAEWTLAVTDGNSVLSFNATDTVFLPLSGYDSYGTWLNITWDDFEVGVGRYAKVAVTPTFDNWSAEEPEPPQPVAEPGSAALVLLGAFGLTRKRRCV